MTPEATYVRSQHIHVLQFVPQVIADMRAVIQDHVTNKVEASGVGNALYVTLLHDIALPNQHDVSSATHLTKAISLGDLKPTGAVQVAFAVQLMPCGPLLTCPSVGQAAVLIPMCTAVHSDLQSARVYISFWCSGGIAAVLCLRLLKQRCSA